MYVLYWQVSPRCGRGQVQRKLVQWSSQAPPELQGLGVHCGVRGHEANTPRSTARAPPSSACSTPATSPESDGST